jgi:hypothetical protein
MSAITSIAGGLSQLFQNLNPSGAASATSNASAGATTGISGHHHHKGGGGGFAKLLDSITSALQSASNASGGSVATDANQTITQALTKIFQNGSLGSIGDIDGDNDGSQPANAPPTGTSNTSTPTNGLPAAFVQTLQSFGVTPQQFQADLGSALKAAEQNGKFDPSALFKNFPPGALVDEIG